MSIASHILCTYDSFNIFLQLLNIILLTIWEVVILLSMAFYPWRLFRGHHCVGFNKPYLLQF